MEKINIILVDWIEYDLYRQKKIGENTICCGSGAILDNMAKYNAGLDYQVTLVITGILNPIHEYCLDKYRVVRHILNPQKSSSDRINFHSRQKDRYLQLTKKFPFVNALHFKDNIGQDLGAYNYGYQLLKKQNYQGDVVFMNSALEGPNEDDWLKKYSDQFHKHDDTGLCGITINPTTKNLVENDFSPHVQSFFLYSNMKTLLNVFPQDLPGYNIKNNRLSLILNGEIGISKAILDADYGITSLAFPDFFYKKGDLWSISCEEIRYKKEFKQFANRI